jgi:sialate O-acetylesterase
MSAFIKSLCATCALTAISFFSHSAVKLPSLISNNMVLQQKAKAALWGWADAGEKVSVTTSWNNKTINVTSDANGKWLTYVTTEKAGGPYTITFKGSNEVKVNNVLLGEVWLASGQSNMEFFVGKMKSASYTGVPDFEKEIKEANFPMIRQIDVANKNADEPEQDFKGDWKVCSPQTVDTFSAVAYYFARKIHQATGFPVGIINATWEALP